ncbi:class I adenylate-forming enzyme family protein [Actibacterium sp. XHP0104]|uniref:class I adenylate-forming enzyme family protein n=1 Tax=Actibacterium sp. XHP0104 TaxID=2984335 RepID=UPI0021E86DFC|nr:class I adenylate-forming enzyme family protein [Actibacterium sp. XHP0104]MCV2882991.1 acyl--CoA ligase [Actibacterium sp. XHP0104]
MHGTGGGIHDDSGHVPMSVLQDKIAQVSRLLGQNGVAPHEPVLVPVRGCAEDVAGILGVIGAGAVAVPVHHDSNMADQVRAVTRARFVIGAGPVGEAGQTGLTRISDTAPPARPLLDGAAIITFTSGSTGAPKGVVLSRKRLNAKLLAIRAFTQMKPAPTAIVPLQLLFSFGQWATFLPLMLGGTVHMTGRFSTDWAARVMGAADFDYLAAVPTMLRLMLNTIRTDHAFDVLAGGEVVDATLRQAVLRSWPRATIQSIYGLTETGTCDLFRRDIAPDRGDDSLGHVTPGVEVSAEPGTGQLMIRSPYAMLGYLDMPELTGSTLVDGWIKTGDQAEILPSGEVVLKGRIKELINRGGNKISPLEVEAAFREHPDVAAALAASVPDDVFGEAIHLLIIRSGASTVSGQELIDWARSRLDRFKLPDAIHFAESLPTGRTGKADRAALRELITGGAVS